MEVVVIEFDGQIGDFPSLVQTLENLIRGGTRHVVLSLASLPFINSTALGYLLAVNRRVEPDGGEIVLTGLQPALRKILSMTNLDVVFPTFDTVEEGIAFVRSDGGPEAAERPVRRHAWR